MCIASLMIFMFFDAILRGDLSLIAKWCN